MPCLACHSMDCGISRVDISRLEGRIAAARVSSAREVHTGNMLKSAIGVIQVPERHPMYRLQKYADAPYHFIGSKTKQCLKDRCM
eukprot:5383025-Amphidinium_carterae.2